MSSKAHILTIALEDYFHGAAFRGVIDERLWGRFESRYENSALVALDLLTRNNCKATFFASSWVARRCPPVLREILRQGHEIALSGAGGPGFRELSAQQFRDRLSRSRTVVEEACGHQVLGYRRSDVRLHPNHLSALEILAQEGFRYDSSVSPAGLAFFSQPWRRFAHEHSFSSGSIWEIPLSSHNFGGLMVPFAGGNYFRQYPEAPVRWAIRRWNDREQHPLVLYFRLWDLDLAQPRIHTGSFIRDLQHYRNGDRMVRMVEDLLARYRFNSIAGYLHQAQQPLAEPERLKPDAVSVISKARVPSPDRQQVSVIVPCYNEEASVPYLARSLDELKAELVQGHDIQFILVDDGSVDKTWQKLNEQFGSRSDTLLLRHQVNRGVAAAIRTGLEHGHEVACSMDCDCSYDPRELKPMLMLLGEGVDLVTASPYHPEGRVSNVPGWRIGLSRGASVLYQIVTGRRLYTFTSCLRVYRRSSALAIDLQHSGFLGVAELAGKYAITGHTIIEHPAVLELRLFGRSKMKIVRTIGGHLKLLTSLVRLRISRKPIAADNTSGEHRRLPFQVKPGVREQLFEDRSQGHLSQGHLSQGHLSQGHLSQGHLKDPAEQADRPVRRTIA